MAKKYYHKDKAVAKHMGIKGWRKIQKSDDTEKNGSSLVNVGETPKKTVESPKKRENPI